MPYAVRKVRNRSCFKVYNKTTKHVFAKCTSKERAEKQLRLLRAIEGNKNFVPLAQSARRTRKNRK